MDEFLTKIANNKLEESSKKSDSEINSLKNRQERGENLEKVEWIKLHSDPSYINKLKEKPEEDLSFGEKSILNGESAEAVWTRQEEINEKSTEKVSSQRSKFSDQMDKLMYPKPSYKPYNSYPDWKPWT